MATTDGEYLSQLTPATQANATDIFAATQGSIGPGTGTTRGVTQAQIIAAGGTVVKALAVNAAQSVFGNNLLLTTATIDQALTSGFVNVTENTANITASLNGHQLWTNFDNILYNVAGGDASTTTDLVGRYVGIQRQANSPNVSVSGLIVGLSDTTGNAGATAGSMQCLELDIAANDVSAEFTLPGERRGILVSLRRQQAGADPSAASALDIIAGGAANSLGFFIPIKIETPFRDAGIDFRGSGDMAGGTSNALWLKQGQFIALDTAGAASAAKVKISSDGTNLVLPEALKLGSTGALIVSQDAGVHVMTINLPLRAPGYTVATLPAVTVANNGTIAWANDARQSGEGAGFGTGCLVTMATDGTWRAVWSGVAPTT